MCDARYCGSSNVRYTYGGYFCPDHQVALRLVRSKLIHAKNTGNHTLEHELRQREGEFRGYDRGHKHRLYNLERHYL